MVLNLNKEIKLVESNESIKEKLMIISLYNEFHNAILSSNDEFLESHYISLMEETFESVVNSLKTSEKKNITAKQFMKFYFKSLKNDPLSGLSQPCKTIKIFEDNLDLFIKSSEYVNAIDKFDTISFAGKVDIMSQFRDYLNDVFLNLVDLYGEEKSEDLRQSILIELSNKVEDFIKDSIDKGYTETIITKFTKPAMKIITKDYLMNQLKNNDTTLIDLQDEKTKKLLSNFKELEKKIFAMGMIYKISGYNSADKKEIRSDDISEVLGISKLRFKAAAFLAGIKTIKMIRKSQNGFVLDSDVPEAGRRI